MIQLACIDGGLCVVAAFGAITAGGSVLGWLGFRKKAHKHDKDCQDDCQETTCAGQEPMPEAA